MLRSNDEQATYIARVDYRNDRRGFGIRRPDRRSPLYTVGKTGTGKSTLLANMIQQDILAGEGLAVLDPHGELAEQALESIPKAPLEPLHPLPDASPKRTNLLAGVSMSFPNLRAVVTQTGHTTR